MRRRGVPPLVPLLLAAAAAAAEVPPPPAFARLVSRTLPNGLQVQVGTPRRPALFSEVLLVVLAGTGGAGGGREEAARVTAEALTCGRLAPAAGGPAGAGAGTSVRLRLAQLGAVVDRAVGREVAVFRIAVPARHTAAVLALLAGQLGRRELPAEVWSEAAARRDAEREREQADSWQRATAALAALVWRAGTDAAGMDAGTDTAGKDSGGTDGAAAPAPTALAAVWAGSYVPRRMVLSVWGAEPADATLDVVERTFGRLPPGPPAAGPSAAEPPVPPGPFALAALPPAEPVRVAGGGARCLLDEGAVPPALLVGLGTEVDGDLDFYGWQLAAHILGASSSSRLQRRLRPAVYTVEAASIPVGARGLTLRIACQTDQVEATRRIVLEELQRLVREPVAQQELDLGRAILRSRLLLDAASARDQLYRRSLALLAVPGVRDPAGAEAILNALTPASLHALLRRTLRPADAATVVVSARTEPLCEGGR